MKLYCRIKVNGKWTFRAACQNYVHTDENVCSFGCIHDSDTKELTE